MASQNFRNLIQPIPTAAFPTITAITETVLIPTLFTSIPAMDAQAGCAYILRCGGTCTTGTAGTLTITPRWGLVIGGTSMTASGAQNYVPSITTAPFLYECVVIIRSLGVAAGANSNVVCTGRWESGGAVATASSQTSVQHTSAGSVAVDTTVASGLWIGVTFSVAPSVIPLWCTFEKIGPWAT
jgi:hypothetical protein